MKTRLARMLGCTRLPAALLGVQRRTVSPWITVLSYHRVGDASPTTEYDEAVVDVSPETFERQIAFLARACTVMTLDELLAFVRGAPLPPNPVLVTFDDGYLDNHDVALPILARHGVSGVFFVATSYIEERRLFWWDRLHLLVKTSRRERLDLAYPRAMSLPLGAARAATTRTLLRIVKDHHGLDLERFLAAVSEAADVNLAPEDERRRVDAMMMTWDHVRALRRAGMDVQSHTRTHRVLQTLPGDALARELVGSREDLEDVLGEPIRSISFPVGKALGPASPIREAVRAAGYELGFSNCSGVNRASRFDPLDARRLAADTAPSDAAFRAMIALPWLGA